MRHINEILAEVLDHIDDQEPKVIPQDNSPKAYRQRRAELLQRNAVLEERSIHQQAKIRELEGRKTMDDNAGSDLGGENEVAAAFEIIKQAMIDDGTDPGSFAHTWHCNIAMAFFDAIIDAGIADNYVLAHCVTHATANDAASRFMKLAFDVDTQA